MLVLKHHGNSNKQSIDQFVALPWSQTTPFATISWAAFARVYYLNKRTGETVPDPSERDGSDNAKNLRDVVISRISMNNLLQFFFGGQYWEVKIEEIWSSFSCFSFGILNYRWILIAFQLWDAEDRRNCETKKSSDPSKQAGKIRGRLKVPTNETVLCWWENPSKTSSKKKDSEETKDKRLHADNNKKLVGHPYLGK